MRLAQKSKANTPLKLARLKYLASFGFGAYMAGVTADDKFMRNHSGF
jgi:hypothetical protein